MKHVLCPKNFFDQFERKRNFGEFFSRRRYVKGQLSELLEIGKSVDEVWCKIFDREKPTLKKL